MKAVTTRVRVVMNLAEGLVLCRSQRGPCRSTLALNYLRADDLLMVLFVCRPQMAPNEPRRAQTVPTGPRGAPDTRSWCGLMNIDILYRYAYSVSCKIRIELLLPIYMTNSDPCTHTCTRAFVHRCGRTARMGQVGQAVVMLLPSEAAYVEFLELNQHITLQPFAAERSPDPDIVGRAREMAAKER